MITFVSMPCTAYAAARTDARARLATLTFICSFRSARAHLAAFTFEPFGSHARSRLAAFAIIRPWVAHACFRLRVQR